MRLLGVALVTGTLLTACVGNGGGPERIDSYPADAGVVRERETDRGPDGQTRYWLRLESANVSGWQPVNATVYENCQVGDIWVEHTSYGCS